MFHDIFSKKEIKEVNLIKARIVADIHEKDSMIFSELKNNPEIELNIQPLKIGDYLIGNTIIERKTANDFISSMIKRRLIEQINQMQQYKEKILIIEGNLENLHTKINPNAIRGFILYLVTKENIGVIFTKDYHETSKYLTILGKQQLKPKKEISLHSRIPKTREKQKQYILEAFPNIGPAKADLLLKKFHSLKNIFNASEEELRAILKNNSKEFKDILEV